MSHRSHVKRNMQDALGWSEFTTDLKTGGFGPEAQFCKVLVVELWTHDLTSLNLRFSINNLEAIISSWDVFMITKEWKVPGIWQTLDEH